MRKKVLVVGGYGFYGSWISKALAREPRVECLVAGRHPPRGVPVDAGRRLLALDARDADAVRKALQDVFAVVDASGPFYGDEAVLAECCAARGVHYIDLAGDRAHVARVLKLKQKAARSGALLVTGAGFSPLISALLVDHIAPEFERISEIQVQLAPGRQSRGGPNSLLALLHEVGRPIRLKQRGRWRQAEGWTGAQNVSLPEPVGRRRLYLCDAPDLDYLPRRFGAESVSVRTGFEQGLLNLGLGLLRRLKQRRGGVSLAPWAPWLNRLAQVFGNAGEDHFGIGVIVRGEQAAQSLSHDVYLLGRRGSGPAIAGSGSVVLLRRWLQQGVHEGGAVMAADILSLDDLRPLLKQHDVVLVRH